MTGAVIKVSFGQELARILRFGLAGVMNTLAGFSVILVLQLGLAVSPALANAAGFLAGWMLSFTLARLFVFSSRDPVRSSLFRYGLAVAASFALNQGILASAGRVLGPDRPWLAQAAGVVTYSVVLFLACRLWVFRQDKGASPNRSPDALPILR